MRRKGSECTRISPEMTSDNHMASLASRSSRRAPLDRDRQRQVRGGVCGCRLLRNARCSAARFYQRAGASVVRAFRLVSKKGSSSTSTDSTTPARNSREQNRAPVVADDSLKSEAVEECIKFMNSSSRKYR